jgi:hypothetical protein
MHGGGDFWLLLGHWYRPPILQCQHPAATHALYLASGTTVFLKTFEAADLNLDIASWLVLMSFLHHSQLVRWWFEVPIVSSAKLIGGPVQAASQLHWASGFARSAGQCVALQRLHETEKGQLH